MYAAVMGKTVTAVFQCLPAISVNGFLTLSLRRLLLVGYRPMLRIDMALLVSLALNVLSENRSE